MHPHPFVDVALPSSCTAIFFVLPDKPCTILSLLACLSLFILLLVHFGIIIRTLTSTYLSLASFTMDNNGDSNNGETASFDLIRLLFNDMRCSLVPRDNLQVMFPPPDIAQSIVVGPPSTVSTLTDLSDWSDSDFVDMDLDGVDEPQDCIEVAASSTATTAEPEQSAAVRNSLELTHATFLKATGSALASAHTSSSIAGATLATRSERSAAGRRATGSPSKTTSPSKATGPNNTTSPKKTIGGRITKKDKGKRKAIDLVQLEKALIRVPGSSNCRDEDMPDIHAAQLADRDDMISRLKTQINELQSKKDHLEHTKWSLENQVTVLKAVVLTNKERVAHTKKLETQLDHALHYVDALKKQVRAHGGFVFGDDIKGHTDDMIEDEEEDDGDGDKYIPAYFPHAAANPKQYTALAIQKRRAMKH